jgi:uracil-DNA glycosylase family 4
MPNLTHDPAPSLAQLLAFYLEAGVDCALMDEPVNRLADIDVSPARPAADPAAGDAPKRPTLASMQPGVPARPVMPAKIEIAPEVAIAAARDVARTAPTITALRGLMETFEGCALKSTATQLVFGDGNPQARIMFVGEAPGRDEDIEGLPFVGQAGKLLDKMLAAIGLDRSGVYISNVIAWRPPGNRTPTLQETQICVPFIQRHIELVNPDILVTLGNPATQTLLQTKDGIMKSRGRWVDYDTGTRKISAIASFHPEYLLRSPGYKRMAWVDLRAIAGALAALPPRP